MNTTTNTSKGVGDGSQLSLGPVNVVLEGLAVESRLEKDVRRLEGGGDKMVLTGRHTCCTVASQSDVDETSFSGECRRG
jgi:hypothetical protein